MITRESFVNEGRDAARGDVMLRRDGPAHCYMTPRRVQAGVVHGVGQALEESTIDSGDVDNLALLAGVWIDPRDETEVFCGNRAAPLAVVRKAAHGLPTASGTDVPSSFTAFSRPS